MIRFHILIIGIVQGVSFRSFTIREARKLNLVGWVRNLSDGKVEIIAQGEKDKLNQFILKLKQGPPDAKIDQVLATQQTATDGFNDFSLRL